MLEVYDNQGRLLYVGNPGADGADGAPGADGAAGPNTVTTSTTTDLTGVLMGNGANVSSVSAVSATEVGYLDGVTSAIQTQINGKAATSHTHTLADVTDVTASAAEVNILDGATLSTAELNYVDGVTSAIQTQLDGKAASSHTHTLAAITDVTASAAELNTLDGITATTAELNTLDGITATTAELNYTDGVTSAIQTQLDGKAATSHTHTLSAGATDVTASAAELNVLDGITATTAELNYTDGVTSAIQTQLDGMVRKSGRSGAQTIYLSTTDNVGGDIYSSSGDTDASLLTLGSAGFNLYANALGSNARIQGTSSGIFLRADGSSVTMVATTATNRIGIGTGNPATKLEVQETETLAANQGTGLASTITLDPGYSGAFTVDRHCYLSLEHPSAAAGAVITDACVAYFNFAAGTHAAVDGPSGTDVDAWIKWDINGTIHYTPALTAPADILGGGGGLSHPQVMARGVFNGPF